MESSARCSSEHVALERSLVEGLVVLTLAEPPCTASSGVGKSGVQRPTSRDSQQPNGHVPFSSASRDITWIPRSRLHCECSCGRNGLLVTFSVSVTNPPGKTTQKKDLLGPSREVWELEVGQSRSHHGGPEAERSMLVLVSFLLCPFGSLQAPSLWDVSTQLKVGLHPFVHPSWKCP